jgi:hypothetical protein
LTKGRESWFSTAHIFLLPSDAARTAAVEVYREPLEADGALWSRCVAQWGAGLGFKMRVERLIRDWFEAQTELNQKLESIMASLWEKLVIKPLERLSDESAGEQASNPETTHDRST